MKRDWDFSDLLLDDSFIEHVNDPFFSKEYIEKLKEDFPEKIEEIELAVFMLQKIRNKKGAYNYSQKQKLWNRIIKNTNGSHSGRYAYFNIAAGFLLILAFGTTLFLRTLNQDNIERFAENTSFDTHVPGLILSDGSLVSVESKLSAVTYSNDGTRIEINKQERKQDLSENAYNQLVVPYGKNIKLTLSDGSKVWVYAGSRLIYPPAFNEKRREVYLYGQAYFEVSSNPDKPFIVKTDYFNTRAVGTRFVVQASACDKAHSTILLEGKVKLSDKKRSFGREVSLSPGQEGSMMNDDSNFKVKKVDHPENYISWVYGHLNFDKEELGQLLEHVARYYHVKIILPETIPTMEISGKLDLKENLNSVLNDIAAFSNLKYKMEGNEYYFYK